MEGPADKTRVGIAGWEETQENLQAPGENSETEVILNPKHDQLIGRCNGNDDDTLEFLSQSERT